MPYMVYLPYLVLVEGLHFLKGNGAGVDLEGRDWEERWEEKLQSGYNI